MAGLLAGRQYWLVSCTRNRDYTSQLDEFLFWQCNAMRYTFNIFIFLQLSTDKLMFRTYRTFGDSLRTCSHKEPNGWCVPKSQLNMNTYLSYFWTRKWPLRAIFIILHLSNMLSGNFEGNIYAVFYLLPLFQTMFCVPNQNKMVQFS